MAEWLNRRGRLECLPFFRMYTLMMMIFRGLMGKRVNMLVLPYEDDQIHVLK